MNDLTSSVASYANLWQDLRYGARMLRKQPSFTLIAVITLRASRVDPIVATRYQ